eukprot:7007367-Heterocapsa_arctica.AAC.1
MYTSAVWPDISFTIKELARRLATPTSADMLRARRLLRYLRDTTDYVLRLTGHRVDSEHVED